MRDKMLLLAYAVLGVIVVVACDVLVSQHESSCGITMEGPANISAGNGTAFFTAGTFEWNQSIIKDLEHNRSFHIPENATENWTIWKGNEMVCYIPRS